MELPERFPCWCQATYSWGGESKKDLGFVEGDLIEALNAGDGSWWMGRLRRDPRAIGLFPSNFVKVLDRDFQPASHMRQQSPLTPNPTAAANGAKSTFRKPFQAYEKGDPRASLDGSREGTPESDKEAKKRERSKFRPYASMKTAQAPTSTLRRIAANNGLSVEMDSAPRIPDPVPRRRTHAQSTTPPQSAGHPQPSHPSQYPSHPPSRTHSPLPATYNDGSAYPQLLPLSRRSSPNPHQQFSHQPQQPSQTRISQHQPPYTIHPQQQYHRIHSRTPSPAPFHDNEIGSSPPPPPPPAHRIVYPSSRPVSRQPSPYDEHDRQRSISPVPPSPGMTPSPLRDAMNDVMSSLQDMSTRPDEGRSPSPMPRRVENGQVWSPDEFELLHRRSPAPHDPRAHTSLGFRSQEPHDYDDEGGDEGDGHDRHEALDSHGLGRLAPDDDLLPTLPPSERGYRRTHRPIHNVSEGIQRTQSDMAFHSLDIAPQPPLKDAQYHHRPDASTSHSSQVSPFQRPAPPQQSPLRNRRSAYELGVCKSLDRTYTTKTNITNSTESSSTTQNSNSTQLTSRSIMSGYSASGFSATSAGSLARRKFGLGSQRGHSRSKSAIDVRAGALDDTRSILSSSHGGSGPSYHESHASDAQAAAVPTPDWSNDHLPADNTGILGGMMAPKAKKSGFFRKMIDSAKTTARTGAATARSTLGSASRPSSRSGSPSKNFASEGLLSRPASSYGSANPAKDMGLGGGPAGHEWMQVRRDVNRSNSLSRREREERIERAEMMDQPALNPVDLLHELMQGDEGLDGLAISEPTDFDGPHLALVDKSTRFIQSLPPMVTAAALAQSYVCRPHRSDVQRFRAIFTWVSERITWEEDFEGAVDTRRLIQTRRGCSEEIATLVRDMCYAVGLHAEIVRGYLKSPGEALDLDTVSRPNHWWNAVIVDGEWRIMDCALAGPTHARRGSYSSAGSQVAESWYFLARPLEICYTHIPLLPEQQHIVPPVDHEILVCLPCACPAYFRHRVEMVPGFNTGLLQLDQLEMAHLQVHVPDDVECVAEAEARAFARDPDGDLFENGDVIRTRAFAQPEWVGGRKRYTIKAVLPGDGGDTGVLKVYAGKRGLMHSVKDNPHALALAVPLTHTGQNPTYEFHLRHPTPHAQRHDLYVAQPQCARLGLNHTIVFCIRQHPSSLSRRTSPETTGERSHFTPFRPVSPGGISIARPSSAMSMVSANTSQTGSNWSDSQSSSGGAVTKPAKLAIQTPSQKIIRLTRKQDSRSGGHNEGGEDTGQTTTWETVVKIGERGTWRGLVLADRSARWCVLAEWECT